MPSPFPTSRARTLARPGRRSAALTAWLSPMLVMLALALPGAAHGQETTESVAQVDALDLISRILGKTPAVDTISGDVASRRAIVTILPSISANPAIGFQVGVSGNAVRRFGPPETTNISNINAGISYTTKRQLNISSRSHIFLPGNRLKLEGDWRYLDTRQPTYGLGAAQPPGTVDSMDFKLVRFYQTIYFEVGQRLLVGPGYLLDHHYDIVDYNAERGLQSPVVAYEGEVRGSTVSSGVSLNALVDTRDSPIYGTRGTLAYLSLRAFPEWLGSTDDWREVQLELRHYRSFDPGSRRVLALWGLGRVTGGHPPYLDLPALGWDTNNRSGRGYPQGRIRGTTLLYGEAEYREVLTRNGLFGLAGFVNLTSSADDSTRHLQSPDFGIGGGLRIKLNKRSHSNITIDYGFGAQGSKGFFLGGSEAF